MSHVGENDDEQRTGDTEESGEDADATELRGRNHLAHPREGTAAPPLTGTARHGREAVDGPQVVEAEQGQADAGGTEAAGDPEPVRSSPEATAPGPSVEPWDRPHPEERHREEEGRGHSDDEGWRP